MDAETEDAAESLSTYVRRFERQKLDVPVRLQLFLEDGRRFCTGRGRLRDLSPEGALVTDLVLEGASLPAGPFSLELVIEGGEYEGVAADALPVRFARVPEFGLGLLLRSVSVEVEGP